MIKRAIISCKESKNNKKEHFALKRKMIKLGQDAIISIIDYKLSRYVAIWLLWMAILKKKIIALAQTYFAIQTRRQELSEKEYSSLFEDEKRLYQRDLTRKGNYSLNIAAKNVGVNNFDKFHNSGYKGLKTCETTNDIAKRKGLRYREDILDNMCSEELQQTYFVLLKQNQN